MFTRFSLIIFDAGDMPASENTAEAEQTAAIEVGTQEDTAEVLYGKQPMPPKGEQEGESSSEQFSYKQLKEQFKDEYQADLQRIIDKRFKNSKKVQAQRDELLEQNAQYGALVEALEQRYGTQDIQQLIGKLSEDNSLLGAQPDGDVQRSEKLRLAEEQANHYKAELENYKAAVQQQAIVEKWQQEAEQLARLYPEFKLENEVDNERFSLALQSGMDMKDAYQYAHFDEILSGAIRYTAENVKKAVTDSRANRMTRPAENGIHHSASAIVKSDVSKLSKEDMEEIDKRVLRGEKISF